MQVIIFKNFNYTPFGLGNNIFNDSWLLDNTGNNISLKTNTTVSIVLIIGYGKII
jgi:hypothetical protein